ncbi:MULTISPECIES: NAD-dependent epimerase/dehydratase family protein [unclassified Roseibium]|uniref:NAD-dependent epimerase/dehydratase family protein n=1 Tax=unclassified Roseibium TaxID=2629323 RepID=UPI00273EC014|nr:MULTISPECIES: NAD-dependent epimerase/dehydratase family protein [unclassified Roseibium]
MSVHLILGGCGFIGRHVALALHRRGDTVILADVVEPSDDMRAVLPAEFRKVGKSPVDWMRLVDGVDVIHHYAWTTVPATADADPVTDLDANLREMVSLLEVLRARKTAGINTKVIFSSSGGTVYGPITRTPVNEEHSFNPTNAYGASKAAAEIYLGYYRKSHGVDCRIARISNPYGAGQNPAKRQGAASTFIFQALDGKPISIWGDGSVVRDYIHIADLAAAMVALTDAPEEAISAVGQPVFNIGSGAGVSLNEILDVLRNDLDLEPIVTYQDGRSFDIPVSVLDISKARSVLNWQPSLTFPEGYARMLSDLRQSSTLFSTLLDSADQ